MSLQQQACSKRVYELTMADIKNKPLSCPTPDMPVWNAHPKVYLPIMKTGKITCPYCGTRFILTDFDPKNAEDITDTESDG